MVYYVLPNPLSTQAPNPPSYITFEKKDGFFVRMDGFKLEGG